MNETAWHPVIVSVSCTPSPAEAFQPFVIRASIVDIFGGEQIEVHYAGEFMAGEV